MNIDLVEGWTGVLNFQLLADGAAYNLTGLTVALLLRNSGGGPVVTTGDTAIVTATAGKVSYTPDAEDLRAVGSPYYARFSVTNGAQIVYFANVTPGVWTVRKA